MSAWSRSQACARLPALLGLLSVWLAAERWLWYLALPRFASARFCGNCFLAAVGVPTELALLGLLLVSGFLLGIHPQGSDAAVLAPAALGVLLTPMVLGVPLFAVPFLVLLWRTIKALLEKARRH